jgi:hypothetical protein
MDRPVVDQPQVIYGGADNVGYFSWRPPVRIPDEHIDALTVAALGFSGLLTIFLKDRIERGGPGLTEKAYKQFTHDSLLADE